MKRVTAQSHPAFHLTLQVPQPTSSCPQVTENPNFIQTPLKVPWRHTFFIIGDLEIKAKVGVNLQPLKSESEFNIHTW